MADNPFSLTPTEKALVEGDAANIIKADDRTAEVLRPVVVGEGDFDGPWEVDMTSVGTIEMEFVTDPMAEILEDDSDGIADVLPDANVEKSDRLVADDGKRYRVRHVRPWTPFGAMTHKRLELKRDYP